jgi:5'-nucleotidase
MQRRYGALWLTAGLLAWIVVVRAQPAPQAITLSVISTNDIHGRISQLPLFGGYVDDVRAARAKDGGAVLLLDAGDIFQGTIESNSTEGAAMVRAYDALHYDAATLGNHEFDFGPAGPHAVPRSLNEDPLGALKARVAQAKFAFVNANLRNKAGARLPVPKLQPSIVLIKRGVKVGIIGGVTMDLLRTTHPRNTDDVVVTPLSDAILEQSARLKKQGARVVIAVVHAGGECHELTSPDDLSSCVQDDEVFRLARALPAGTVDLIVAGHTHAGVAQRVHGIAIIEAFSNGRAFGRADIRVPKAANEPITVTPLPPVALCPDNLDKPSCASDAQYEGLPVKRDAHVSQAIAADLQRARLERNKPIGLEVTAPVTRESKVECPLSNLVADLMLRASPGADAAFSNAGGVRIPLPKGPLSYGTVFEMMPFDNAFATLHITAAQLSSILARNLSVSSGILALSGLSAAASCAHGKLEVALFDAKGQRLEPTRELTVITSDFLANSGDGLLTGIRIDPKAITIEHNRLIRDALLEGLMAYPGGKLDGDDKRLYDPAHPRLRYPGPRPVRCEAVK